MTDHASHPHKTVLRAAFDHTPEDAALWFEPAEFHRESSGLESVETVVRDAVAVCLTPRQREVVELHFFEGLSQGQIARQLGVSQQVVQKALYGTARGGRLVGGALPRLRAWLAQKIGS